MSARKLWTNRDFVKFWGGDAVNRLGSQVTVLALPLSAIETLHVSPGQLGLLNTALFLPFACLTLFAGVWLERTRRRPVMIGTNLVASVLLCIIPVLYLAGVLTIDELYVVALATGSCSVFFELAYQAYVPSIVERDQLVEANGKLQASESVAQIGGPGLGGLLIQAVGAPLALFIDAFSFLWSAVGLALIRAREPGPAPRAGGGRVVTDIRDGLRYTFARPWLRACALESGCYNLMWLAVETVFLLYAARSLHMPAALIGAAISSGAAGSLIGALLAERVGVRWGTGRAMLWPTVLGSSAMLLVPLVSGGRVFVVAVWFVAFVLNGAGSTIASIQVVSARQAATPPNMLSRVNATFRFLSWGFIPLGALAGGFLSEQVGMRPTLLFATAGLALSALWLVFSPIPRMKEPPRLEAAHPRELVTARGDCSDGDQQLPT
jgi:MFS family permease